MAENKKSVILYVDLIHTFEELTDAQAGRLIKHFFRYVNDKNPDPPDKMTKIIFEPIKQQLKRDLIKWEQERVSRSEAGKKGMASRWKSKTKITDDNSVMQPITNITDNVTVNDTVTVNVNDTVNENRERAAAPPPFKKLSDKEFYESLKEFVNDYPKEMLRSFYNYWSEKDEHGKMKFQLQKTWELKKRLITWSSKNFNDVKTYNGMPKKEEHTGPKLPIIN